MAFKFNKGQQVIGDLVSADDPQRNTNLNVIASIGTDFTDCIQ